MDRQLDWRCSGLKAMKLRCAETFTRSGMVNRVVVNDYDHEM